MAAVGFLRYPHTVDVYIKTVSVNPAGQKFSTFVFSKTVPAIINSPARQFSAGPLVRTAPYQDFIPVVEMIVPGIYANTVINSSRVYNIKDRYGNILETGPYEIINIQAKYGWNSKKHHLMTELRTVVEQS